MPLTAPNLDDRQYADIVAAARTLIPRYTPEWTDQNDSDPGMTLVQLFAWMTDLLIYRLNQVPERNYIKFLQLLGIELKPARPAHTSLTFTLSTNTVDVVYVPTGVQVAVSGGSTGSAPLIFETDTSLVALGATLAQVQTYDGFGYTVQTGANTAANQSYAPFGAVAPVGSALLLGFDTPLPFTAAQIDLCFVLYANPAAPPPQSCDPILRRVPLPVTLVWEYWSGSRWTPLDLDRDDTRALSLSGHIYLSGPGSAAQKAVIGNVSNSLYWIRARIASGAYQTPPMFSAVLTNTVDATQAVTVKSEVLGGSDGTPDQKVSLANTPIVTLELVVDEGLGPLPWTQVDDFYASGPGDPNYVLDATTGVVTFGDGAHGRIPVANPALPNANIIAQSYQWGGGSGGNTGAHTITDLQTTVDGVQSVSNLFAAEGGTDEETLADAELRAPLTLQSKGRAVTANDFELLATQTPTANVARAKALPLMHPDFGSVPIPGVVTVIVVPNTTAPNPMPTQTTLAAVCAQLNAHRLLTSEVYVVAPVYRLVRVVAPVIALSTADLNVVQNAVVTALLTYLHPLTGGEDGTGWPFGGTIYFSRLSRVILDVAGVDRIQDNQLVIYLDGEAQTFCRDVPLNPNELVYSTDHGITTSYDTGSSS